jgi:hypothetical protein
LEVLAAKTAYRNAKSSPANRHFEVLDYTHHCFD